MGQKIQVFPSYLEKWKIKWKSSFILTNTNGKTLIIGKPLAYLSRKIVNLNDICNKHILKRKIKVRSNFTKFMRSYILDELTKTNQRDGIYSENILFSKIKSPQGDGVIGYAAQAVSRFYVTSQYVLGKKRQ